MRRLLKVAALAALGVLVAGCPKPSSQEDAGFDAGYWPGGGGDGGGGGNKDGGTDAGTDGGSNSGSRTVTLTRTVHYIKATGTEDVPQDLSGATIAALVWNGSSYTSFPGTGTAQGTATIPNVPAGEYLLRYQSTSASLPIFVSTSQSNVDLSYWAAGRPDEIASDGGTRLLVSAAGLPAWTTGDQFQVISGNANVWGFNAESALDTPPTEGVPPTTLNFDYPALMGNTYGYPTPLVSAAKGDRFYLTYFDTKSFTTPDGGQDWYQSVEYAYSSSNVSVQNGVTNPVAAAFTQPATQESATLDWRRGQFQALVPQVNPNAQLMYDSVYFVALPFSGDHGLYASSGDLATYFPSLEGDLNAPLQWRNPYPSDWHTAGSLTMYVRTRHTETDGGVLTAYGYYSAADLAPSFSAQPIAPVIGPVTGLEVDGADGFADGTISSTPAITWSAPSLGTASFFRVEVYRMFRENGVSRRLRVARFLTKGTAAHVPAGILQPGERYIAVVTANVSSINVENTPFQYTFPEYSMDAISGLWTVQ